MRKLVSLLMVSALLVSGCSSWRGSALNPGNWGGGRTQAAEGENTLIPEETSIFKRRKVEAPYEGTPVHQLLDARLEPASAGAILLVRGLPLRQGAFDVRLVPDSPKVPENGIMTYTMRALQPVDTPQGPEQTRSVEAGVFISTADLARMSGIRVVAAANQRTLSPR